VAQPLVERARLLATQVERDASVAREQAARAAAEAALSAHSEFLAVVAHDLRQPLTSIRGRVQLLQRRALREPTQPIDLAALALIEAQTAMMRRLIDQLLDTTRLEAGQALPLLRTDVDLTVLLDRVVEECRATTHQHELVIRAPAPGRPVGCWDGDRLEQVVRNLLDNAIKYSPDGEAITVTLTQEEKDAGSWAVLVVQDQGLGIPAAEVAAVFERFHRGSNVASRIPGLGIGLASVWAIVEQHGGTIAVESKEGRGSRFTLWLPLG
jgi:signal transduction histidine kinase